MNKTPFILAVLLALTQLCHAQAYNNEKVIYFDENGQKTKEKNAFMLEQVIKMADTLYQFNFYQMDAPMFRSFQAADPEGNTLSGDYRCYDGNGWIDTLGSYRDGKRDGEWGVYSNGRYTGELLYDQGKLMWAKDTLQLKQESNAAAAANKKDSLGDKTFTKVEIESAFPGGPRAWLNYLEKNMHYPNRAVKKGVQGMVVIAFVVDKEGHVPPKRVFVDRSVEYSLDQEALRIIFAASAWMPAVQNGRPVNSYKKQPIVFRLR